MCFTPSTQATQSSPDTSPLSSLTERVGQSATHGLPTLTRPEHYLAVPLAMHATSNTCRTLINTAVKMLGELRLGARKLGLIAPSDKTGSATPVLTDAGEAVVTHVSDEPAMSIGELEEMSHRGRLLRTHPQWGELTQRVLAGHPFTRAIIATLQDLSTPVCLPELARRLYADHPDIAMECLLTAAPPETAALTTADAYLSTAAYQFKTALCHGGILATPGQDSASLTPATQSWALDPVLWPADGAVDDTTGGPQ